MPDLIAIGYDDTTTAIAALDAAEAMAADLVIQPDALAAIVRNEQGKFRTVTNQHAVGAGATWGMFWGLLFGVLFFVPVFGMALGAAFGALGGKLGPGAQGALEVRRHRHPDLAQRRGREGDPGRAARRRPVATGRLPPEPRVTITGI
jgi:hypothetical protein